MESLSNWLGLYISSSEGKKLPHLPDIEFADFVTLAPSQAPWLAYRE